MMASSILNSDDGVISGTAGLKSVGGDDGNLVFQSKGTETARINTDKQIVAAAGTASLPALTTTGDVNTGIFFPAADTIAFGEGGAEAMRVDSSGNVGIGTTSPAVRLQVNGASSSNTAINIVSTPNAAESSSIQFFNNTVSRGRVGGANDFDGLTLDSSTTEAAAVIRFRTGGTSLTERARITPQGYFKASDNGTYAGATDANHEFRKSDNGSNTLIARATSGTYDNAVLLVQCDRNTTNGSYNFFVCSTPGVATKLVIADSGNVTNVNNSYGAISDVKLKQDIVDAGSQWDDIKNLRVRKFRFNNDPTGPLQIGVIAQEIEEVSPGLIDESPDYEEVEVTDEDGNIKTERIALNTTTKSVKYSVLYMKAVKALQEAIERIETLEAKVAALEGAE